MFKKVFRISLLLLICFLLTGCGSSNLKFQIDGKKVVLNKTTVGDLKDVLEITDNVEAVGYLKSFLKAKIKSTGIEVNVSVASPKKNVITALEDCVITEIYAPDVENLNGIKVNGKKLKIGTKRKKLEKSLGFVNYEDKKAKFFLSFDMEATKIDNRKLKGFYYMMPDNSYKREASYSFASEYNNEDYGFKFKNSKPKWTDNYMFEFSINGEVYTVGQTKLGELLKDDKIFISSFDYKNYWTDELSYSIEEGLKPNGTITLELSYFCESNMMGTIKIKAYNPNEESISLNDAIIFEVEADKYDWKETSLIFCKEFDFSKDDVFTKKDVEKKLGKNYYFEYNTMTYVANGDLLENKTDEEKEDIIDEAKRKIEIDLYSAEEEDVYEIIITDRTLLKEDTYY